MQSKEEEYLGMDDAERAHFLTSCMHRCLAAWEECRVLGGCPAVAHARLRFQGWVGACKQTREWDLHVMHTRFQRAASEHGQGQGSTTGQLLTFHVPVSSVLAAYSSSCSN
eukprot:1160006-Pelagomonas_calceolata.AAC.4